jgi:hypothetical protein
MDLDPDADSVKAVGSLTPPFPTAPADPPIFIRTCHVLNSDFKFNTALALSQGSPLVAYGHSCVDCSLNHAVKAGQLDRLAGHGRRKYYYVINRVENPARTTPLAFPVRQARQAIDGGGEGRLSALS